MLSPISLESGSLSLSQQRTNPVQLRTIPSTKDEAHAIETELNQQTNNTASVQSGRVSTVQAPSEVSKPSENAPVAPERPRFDTFERTQPMPSAGIYSVKAGSDGNREISFQMPQDVLNTPVSSKTDMTSGVANDMQAPQGAQLPSESPVLPAQNEANTASEASAAVFSTKKENLAVPNQAVQAELDAVNQNEQASQVVSQDSEDSQAAQDTTIQTADESTSALPQTNSNEQSRVDLLNDELSKALEQMENSNREQANSQNQTYVEAVLS